MAASLAAPRSLLALMAMLSLCACKSALPGGEVLLIVDAAPNVQGQTASLHLVVRGSSNDGTVAEKPFEREFPVGSRETAWPFRFALLPLGGDVSRRYVASISAHNADGVAVASVQVSSGFVAGKALALHLRFDDACLVSRREPCSAAKTCVAGECVSPAMATSELPEATREELDAVVRNRPMRDAGLDSMTSSTSQPSTMADSGGTAHDAATDAATDAAADASQPKAGGGSDTAEPPAGGRPATGTSGAPASSGGPGGSGSGGAGGGGNEADMERCGNGVLDDGETCESGTDSPCPGRCNDDEACTADRLEGAAISCDVSCSFERITQRIAGDGCCPDGADANTDSDCKVVCGNGVPESGERCDGDCPTSPADCNDNLPCTRDEVTGTDCERRCVHREITGAESASDGCCPLAADSTLDPDCEPVCGNRVTEAGEDCDDGEHIGGDGCSAECEYDNNTMTPGDDRPGYVACGAGSCGPDARCCVSGSAPTACVGETASCPAPFSVCDGPEDCADGEECWSERYAFCAPSEQSHARGNQLCHIDPHCDAGWVCSSGACQASP